MTDRPHIIRGDREYLGPLFACVDPEARYTNSAVCDLRFGSTLTPFASEIDARAALLAAGATPVEGGK